MEQLLGRIESKSIVKAPAALTYFLKDFTRHFQAGRNSIRRENVSISDVFAQAALELLETKREPSTLANPKSRFPLEIAN